MGLIFSIEKDLGWMSWLDYGMFIQNICLLARNYGLHTCPQAAWGLIYKKVNTLLNSIPNKLSIKDLKTHSLKDVTVKLQIN